MQRAHWIADWIFLNFFCVCFHSRSHTQLLFPLSAFLAFLIEEVPNAIVIASRGLLSQSDSGAGDVSLVT